MCDEQSDFEGRMPSLPGTPTTPFAGEEELMPDRFPRISVHFVNMLFAVVCVAATETAAELPPEIQADRFLVRAERMEAEKNYVGALKALDDHLALQKAHNLSLPDDFHFRVARLAFSARDLRRTHDAATLYLTGSGREGKFYRDAVALLEKAEYMMPSEPEMVVIPGGRYQRYQTYIDSPKRVPGKPSREVRIESFEMSRYEVTFEEFDRFSAATGRTPPHDGGWGRGRRPVINVSWHDAVAYTRWLSLNTGRNYRLPSEWEWEYAAFGGITGDRYNPDANAIAWYKGNSNGRTHPVGGKAPNAYGLYDMLGNAWEFAQDCHNHDVEDAPADGSAWVSGECDRRVVRGAGANAGIERVFARNRVSESPDARHLHVGFRVARTSELKE